MDDLEHSPNHTPDDQFPPGAVVQATLTDPATGAALPADVQAFMAATGAIYVAEAEWQPIADIPGGGISFPDVMQDAAYTYILGQIAGNFLSVCKLQGTTLIAAYVVPSPGTLRSGAYGGAGGEVFSDFHGEGHTASLQRYLIPGWQAPQGGPGPGPGPGGGVSQEEFNAYKAATDRRIAALEAGGIDVRLTQEDGDLVAERLSVALSNGNSNLNKRFLTFLKAAFSREPLQTELTKATTAALTALDISDKETRLGQSFYDQVRNIVGAQLWEGLIRSALVPPSRALEWVRGLSGFPWGMSGQTTFSETHEHTTQDELDEQAGARE